LKAHVQRPGRILRMAHLGGVAGLARVPENGYPGELGQDLLEKLYLLLDEFGRHRRHPRDVPAWASKAGDEPARHSLLNHRHDDGDGPRRLSYRLGGCSPIRHDDHHFETHELGGQAGKSVVLALRPSGVDSDVLTFHVTQFAQTLAEGLKIALGSFVRKRTR